MESLLTKCTKGKDAKIRFENKRTSGKKIILSTYSWVALVSKESGNEKINKTCQYEWSEDPSCKIRTYITCSDEIII